MAITAFKESLMSGGVDHEEIFESFEGRCLRYKVLWAFYEGTVYRRINRWSTAYKHQLSLYKYIRNLYNPAGRLGDFYQQHLWGGALSPVAGPEGAIPIETEDEALRSAIATLWKESNFATLKDVIALRGSIQGDVVLQIADDPTREKIYIERLDPGTIVDLTQDPLGNVKGYVVEEQRQDPDSKTQEVTYRLEVTRDNDLVVYSTFKNNSPFGWNGQPDSWDNPYGFVPLVLIKHRDVGLDWGVSELHGGRSKIHELDDLASMVGDQIRKTIDPVFLMKGMSKTDLTVSGATRVETGATNSRPEPGREELKAIWDAPIDGKAEPMLATLNLGDTLKHIDSLLRELERDYPELQQDIWATGATSGRALRVARQRVEAKVHQRRENYDNGLVRLQSMGVAIGGMRGYSAYSGFNLDSYGKGDLDHRIGERPVFTPDPLDSTEIDQAFWLAAQAATGAGASLEGYLKQKGWSEEQIEEITAQPEEIA